jgi:hypothetical protein
MGMRMGAMSSAWVRLLRGGRGGRRSFDPAGLGERQPRRAREDAGRVALAQVDQEVGAPAGAGEERRVHLGVVEAGHRPAVQAQRARGQDQVGALQAAVAQAHGLQRAVGLALEPALGVGVREQHRQLLVEVQVVGDDDHAGRGHGLGAVALVQGRFELGFGFGRFHEHEARRAAVGGGRAQLEQLVQALQGGVVDLAGKGVVGAGLAEQLVEGVGGQRGHRISWAFIAGAPV